MALNKEVWINQIKEGFYPDDSFLKKVVDYSEFVDNNKLHIPSAGIDPKVLIDNTTYPINVVGRGNEDNEIKLQKFETENTLVRRPDVIEYSYNKLESVIRQHRATLRKNVVMVAAHAYSPDKDTLDNPIVMTTGDIVDGRKRITFADLLALKERFDTAEIPLEDRYLVLHPKHVTDLLLEDVKLYKNLTQITDGEPAKFAGFGVYQFAHTANYRTINGELQKIPYGAVSQTGDKFSSFGFYAPEVMKADGDIYMYSAIDDPRERATIVGFDKRFVALPIRGKCIGAVVSTFE